MKRYFEIDTKKIYDEDMKEVGTFNYTNEVKGLTKVVNITTAGGKMIRDLHKHIKINDNYVAIIDELPLNALSSVCNSLTKI